mgnify:CR=1 FL=1
MVVLPGLVFADSLFTLIPVLCVLAFVLYIINLVTKVEGNEGYSFTVFPWVNTFPETLTSVVTAIHGYTTASIWNSVFSATFDLMILGVSGIRSGYVRFAVRDLVYPTVVGGFLTAILLLDGSLNLYDGFMLYIVLLAVSIIAIARYGFRVVATKQNIVRHVLGLVGIAVVAYIYSLYVMALCEFVSERIAGIVSAVLTSLPDVVTAVVYGLETPEAQSELLGCIMHDFNENLATTAIVAGLFGRELVDANPLLTVITVAFTMIFLVATLADGDIDTYDGLLLVGVFGILATLAILL